MKKISVLIPCYNEQENVEAISKAVLETLTRDPSVLCTNTATAICGSSAGAKPITQPSMANVL